MGTDQDMVNIKSLTGTGFQSGAMVKLTRSGQPDIFATNVIVVTSTKITCIFNLLNVAIGSWNVVVTNPDNKSDSLADGFTVIRNYSLTTRVVDGQGNIFPPSGTYLEKTRVRLEASPGTGFYLERWTGTDDDLSTALVNTVTMTSDKTVTVKFAPLPQQKLMAKVIGGNGKISPAEKTVYRGEVIYLTATPDPNYRLKKWTGTDNDFSILSTNQVTMTLDKEVTVEFEAIPGVYFHLTGEVIGENGQLSPNFNGYGIGTVVILQAVPNHGFCVKKWTGTDHDEITDNTNTVTMNADKTVQVEFEIAKYQMTASVPGGNGTIWPLGGKYPLGLTVNLTATPGTGYKVKKWTGTNNDSFTGLTNAVTINDNCTVTVEFEPNSNDPLSKPNGEQTPNNIPVNPTGTGSCGTSGVILFAGILLAGIFLAVKRD